MDKLDAKMVNSYTGKDLSDRLSNTICRYDGKPVIVGVEGGGLLSLWPLDMSKPQVPKSIKGNDPLLDISSIELGYSNNEIQSATGLKYIVRYTGRAPSKQYRQGISGDHLKWYTIDGDVTAASINHTALYRTQGFEDSLRDIFPTLDEAFASIDEKKQVAISQAIAFQKINVGIILLYFRTKNVGYIEPGKKVVKIPNERGLAWVVHRYLHEYRIEYE